MDCYAHGHTDNNKSVIELSEKARRSKLFLTCGYISSLAQYLLSSLDIKSRQVAGLTINDWNTYDNGHTLLVAWRKEYNKRVLHDLDNNSYFFNTNSNELLSLIEFSERVAMVGYRIRKILEDTRLDVSNFISDGYEYNFILEAINAKMEEWYKRVIQIPLIYSDSDRIYFFSNKKYKKGLNRIHRFIRMSISRY